MLYCLSDAAERNKYKAYTKEWCGIKSEYKMYFSPYTGTTYRQRRQLSKFLIW
jgi:hypothetical protein